MMDTMGQAAALTGGYGNSYAQNAGQQAYQEYLTGLNDKIPELYQLALDKYNQEGSDMLNQYSVLQNQESQDYSRYQDTVSAWENERQYLQNQYNTERDFDYGQYQDALAAQQWQTEFDEDKRRYDQEWAAAMAEESGSGSSGGSGGGGSDPAEEAAAVYDEAAIRQMLRNEKSAQAAMNLAESLIDKGYSEDLVYSLYEQLYRREESSPTISNAKGLGKNQLYTKA